MSEGFEFKRIDPGIWKPESQGATLTGVLIDKRENTGTDGESTIYVIENDEGIWQVWGSKILDDRLGLCPIPTRIKILYKGKKKAEKTNREYHDWDVFKAVKTNVVQ